MSHWSYKNKHSLEIVEAYQWSSDCGNHTVAYPRWLLDMLLDNRIESNDGGKTWYMDREGKIGDGDWIIKDSDAHERCASDRYFKENYVKEPS